MNLQDPALTFSLALAAGILAQSVAHHLRMPGIILLLAVGVLLGPEGANIIRPENLGPALQPIVGLSVAVILFEGGLQLNIGWLRREAVTIRRLITVGALVTLTGGTVAAMLVLGWEWQTALLFGSLVVVTGPTVINPLTRRIRLKQKLRTILEAEGVLIDPIGAIVAVVALDFILATTTAGVTAGLLGFPKRLGLGLLIGAAGGVAIGTLLKPRRVVPSGLQNVFTLAMVLALYQMSHAILPESGIMTVAIAGLVVGNMRRRRERELAEFKEQLTMMLVGLLFVLLSAAVDLGEIGRIGWAGVGTVAVLIFLVRPLDILLCTWGSDLEWRERAFLAWLAPRGIVAFAVSSLFADELAAHGMPDEGAELRAMVFLVIAITVVLLGGTGGVVANLLRVRMRARDGYAIVGANPLGRALGRALREARTAETPIVLIDTNAHETHLAQAEGFRVVFGNASEERTLLQAEVEGRKSFIAITPNEGVNLLLSNRVHEVVGGVTRMVAIDATDPHVTPQQVLESEALVLFARGLDFERWSHELRHDRGELGAWMYEGDATAKIGDLDVFAEGNPPLVPLVHRRGRTENPVTNGTDVRSGDLVWFLWMVPERDRVAEVLQDAGWRRWTEPDV